MSDPIDHTDGEVLRELYHDQGLKIAEIVERSSVTYGTIIHWMDKHDIDRRERGADPDRDGTPWRDEDTLRGLHHDEKKTTSEIADEFNCGQGTVAKWLNKHGIENRTLKIKRDRNTWTDPGEIRELYHEKGLSLQEVGERIGCDRKEVRKQMQYHGIPRRDRLDAVRNDYVPFRTGTRGYEAWEGTSYEEDREFLRVHRLLAIACGADPHKVFSGEYEVHHRNGLKWGNWPSNIELLTRKAHHEKHLGINEETRREIAEAYNSGESGYKIAKRFDVSRRTIPRIHKEFFDERELVPKRARDPGESD